MRLAALLLLGACATPQPVVVLPGDLPAACATEARLPRPPRPPRTLQQTTTYANAAATTANHAIAERDDCAEAYARLRKWALGGGK